MSRLSSALADRYRIERELGQGGMAMVYLAHDVRHDRRVALKVLRAELAAVIGATRFLQEIKTTANLQHPHILPLHDSGEVESTVFYVMPYVEGETLRDRLTREKQLPVEEAIRIAIEVAGALEYAHQHKVIHRDIKPENILLQGGHALVADFGIALAASKTEGGTRMTETGMSLGTPHYMSPEQAMGEREITAKSDVYALGCVLYEMLTGEPPFSGPTAQAIVARVLTEEPRSLTLQRRSIPPNVEAAVLTALAKLPADRFSTAGEFAAALRNTGYTTAATTRSGPVTLVGSRQRTGALLPWALVAAAIGLFAWQTLRSRPAPPPPPVTRFTIQFDGTGRIADNAGSPIAVSPDGSRIVYVGQDSAGRGWLYSRGLDREDPVQIAGTGSAFGPFFSPDGSTIGFTQEGRLRKVGIGGGAVVTISDVSPSGSSWGPDGNIYFTSNNMLWRVSEAGGTPQGITVPDTAKGESLRWPDALPDGRGILLTLVRGGQPTLAFVSLPDFTLHDLNQPGMYPRWVDGGYLTFVQQDATLFTAPFDAKGAKLAGAPVPVTDNVRFGPAFPGKLGISRTGTLAYLGGRTALRELVLMEQDGKQTILPTGNEFYSRPRFSPDGQRVVFQIINFGARASADLWIADLKAGNVSRITFDSSSSDAAWMPDGRHLAYKSAGGAIYRTTTDGSGVSDSLFARPNRNAQELEVSPDGRFIVFRDQDNRTRRDVWIQRLDSAEAARPVLRTPFDERGIALSRDGQWLAYTSNETGSDEIFVRRLVEGSGHWRVTRSGGTQPRWGPGYEVFYRVGDTVMTTTMRPGPEPQFSGPRSVLVGQFNSDRNVAAWDISPDGKRFIFSRDRGETDTPRMNVLLHWFDRLRAQAHR